MSSDSTTSSVPIANTLEIPMMILVGFDSAWTDQKRNPGAICAVAVGSNDRKLVLAPTLASFDQALGSIVDLARGAELTIIAIDQPTIVNNQDRSRPVERVVSSLIGWMGGGVQPANRNKIGMFCDQAPIWKFLGSLNAIQDPLEARSASSGRFVIEVFPALALATLAPDSCSRLGALKYNPANKKFSMFAWRSVTTCAATHARDFEIEALAEWLERDAAIPEPTKADQDRLDSALCVLIALRWRLSRPENSVLLGDLENGYIVTPVSEVVRDRLIPKARQLGIPVDGQLESTE